MMKIDVEGAERAVLQGASETIRRCRPTIWVELLDRQSRQAAQAMFAGFGYARYPIWLGEHERPVPAVRSDADAHPRRSVSHGDARATSDGASDAAPDVGCAPQLNARRDAV